MLSIAQLELSAVPPRRRFGLKSRLFVELTHLSFLTNFNYYRKSSRSPSSRYPPTASGLNVPKSKICYSVVKRRGALHNFDWVCHWANPAKSSS